MRTGAFQPDGETTAAGRELDGVREEVRDHLLEAVGVGAQRARDVVDRRLDDQSGRIRVRPDGADRSLDGGGRGDEVDVELEVPGVDTRPVEQIVDRLLLLSSVQV